MKKYISEFIALTESFINGRLESASEEEVKAFLRELEQKILYFQHERLIHLIVTMTFALMTVMTLMGICSSGYLPLAALMVLLLVLLIPYIRHYYILENGTQTLYRYFDTLEKDRTPKGTEPFRQ